MDLLRGLAVLLVMLLHFSLTYRLPAGPLGAWFTPHAVAVVVMNGNFGVTIFFVISGYLITGLAVRRHGSLAHVPWRDFYVLRASRLAAPLGVALTAITGLGLLGAPSFVNRVQGEVMPAWWFVVAVGSVLTFWHNVLMQSVGYFNYALNILWSLSVEEVFYLLFPWACARLGPRALIGLALGLVVSGPAYRALHVDHEVDYLYGYLACFDAIAIGCLTAAVAPRLRWPAHGRAMVTAIGAITLGTSYLSGIGDHEVFGFTGVALGTALLLASDAGGPASERWWASPGRWLGWLGRHSYELYLFHIVVLGLLRDAVPRDALPATGVQVGWLALFLALSCGVAAGVSRWVSIPASRWMRAAWGARRVG